MTLIPSQGTLEFLCGEGAPENWKGGYTGGKIKNGSGMKRNMGKRDTKLAGICSYWEDQLLSVTGRD
jgi:hypothetical protein